MAVQVVEHSLGSQNSVVLRFFEDGDAAEVGIGEQEASVAARQAAALRGKNGTDRGANHGVAHAHDVDA